MKNIAIKGELMLVHPFAKPRQLLATLFRGQDQPVDICLWHRGKQSMQGSPNIAFPLDSWYSIDPNRFLARTNKN